MNRSYTYTCISQRGHSKAESILNLYKMSAKNQISKICDAALTENKTRLKTILIVLSLWSSLFIQVVFHDAIFLLKQGFFKTQYLTTTRSLYLQITILKYLRKS